MAGKAWPCYIPWLNAFFRDLIEALFGNLFCAAASHGICHDRPQPAKARPCSATAGQCRPRPTMAGHSQPWMQPGMQVSEQLSGQVHIIFIVGALFVHMLYQPSAWNSGAP